MNWMYVLEGFISVALIVYLLLALLKAEKF